MTIIYQRDPRYWEPHFEYQSVFFKECAIAGTSFHIEADDDIWNELEEGTERKTPKYVSGTGRSRFEERILAF